MPPATTPSASNQSSATALLGQIPFGAIIGGPLTAAVDAQGAAARACTEFIRNVGFSQVETPALNADGTPKLGADGKALTAIVDKVRDVTFIVERSAPRLEAAAGGGGGGDGGGAVTTTTPNARLSITVPLLTIMPLPFIRIESMDINFKASIAAVDASNNTETSSTAGTLNANATLGFGWWKVNASGALSSKKDSTATKESKYSVEHTMDISVHAVQDSMPAGMAQLLAILTQSIVVARA